MANRRGASALRLLELTLFVVGLIAVGYCVWVLAEGQAYQRYQEWAFEQRLDGHRPTLWGFVRSGLPGRSEQASGGNRDDSFSGWTKGDSSRNGGELLGKLEVPRLKLSAMVLRGVEERELRRGIGLIPGTSDPGAPGNVGIAGHRDSFFRRLRHIQRDDSIRITTEDGVYTYTVEAIDIVNPKRVDVLDATEHPTLTLVTCYPFDFIGTAPERYIVRARQLSSTPVAHSGAAAAPKSTQRAF